MKGEDAPSNQRRASQEWLGARLASLDRQQRAVLLQAADLMSRLVAEDA